MTDYYFGQGGDNGQNGLTYANRRATWASIKTLAGPGDTVFICSSTGGGGFWEMNEQITMISGSVGGGMFTLAVRANDDILVDVVTPGATGTIEGNGQSYFQVIPGSGTLELGDTSAWNPVGTVGDQYAADFQIHLQNCHHYKFIGTGTGVLATTNSNFKVHGGSDYNQEITDTDCDMGLFEGIDFSKHGTNERGSGSEWGDLCLPKGDHELYHKCTWRLGGHNQLSTYGHNTVIRACESDADWTSEGTGKDGTRCMVLQGGNESNGGTEPWGPQLLEDSILQNPGPSGNASGNPTMKMELRHGIVRRNHLWGTNGKSYSFQIRSRDAHDPLGSGLGTVTYLKRYHNTIYAIGRGCTEAYGPGGGHDFQFQYCDQLNNILDWCIWVEDAGEIRDAGAPLNGFPDSWRGYRVQGQIANFSTARDYDFSNPEETPSLFDLVDGESNYPAVFKQNKETRPSYVGNPDGGDRTIAAFQPAAGGSQVGYALPLVQVAAADSGSGTTLIVETHQARNFYDGWGMQWLGEDAKRDYICVAPAGTDPRTTGTIVRIAYNGINYNNDNITLDAGVSRNDGDDVWGVLPDGVTIMTDSGAGQTAMPAGGGAGAVFDYYRRLLAA